MKEFHNNKKNFKERTTKLDVKLTKNRKQRKFKKIPQNRYIEKAVSMCTEKENPGYLYRKFGTNTPFFRSRYSYRSFGTRSYSLLKNHLISKFKKLSQIAILRNYQIQSTFPLNNEKRNKRSIICHHPVKTYKTQPQIVNECSERFLKVEKFETDQN